MATATLTATVTVAWQCQRGFDHDATVDVTYTFDGGDDVRVLSSSVAYGDPVGISDWDFDELVWEAVNERADEDYCEWLADNADHFADLMAEAAE